MTGRVDVNVPRFSQAMTALLTAVAFLVDLPMLVGVVFVILAVAWAGGPRSSLWAQVYVRWLRPRLDPDGPSETEDAAPPRFASLLGTVFLGAAAAAFLAGLPVLGWALTLVVTALAALAAVTRICVGCIFYQRVVAH